MKKAKQYPFLALQRQRFRLHYANESSLKNLPDERRCRLWLWHALKNTFARAEIGLLFLDEAEARAYNRDYRNKDYATNILSFALDEGEFSFVGQDGTLHGDLVVCPQVVEREAAEQGKSVQAHYAHLLIHGALHLMGHDHIDEAEAEEMEALEIKLLAQFGITDPYE